MNVTARSLKRTVKRKAHVQYSDKSLNNGELL